MPTLVRLARLPWLAQLRAINACLEVANEKIYALKIASVLSVHHKVKRVTSAIFDSLKNNGEASFSKPLRK